MPLPGGNNIPYRPNCAGSIDCGLGPAYQHARSSDAGIARFIYDGTVQDYTNHGNPNIAPYERLSAETDCLDATGCDPSSDYHTYFPECSGWYQGDLTGATQQFFNVANPQSAIDHFSQPTMLLSATVIDEGTGYAIGDILIVPDGTLTPYDSAATLYVSGISPLKVKVATRGGYWSNPSSPSTPTGGSGTGATFTLAFTPSTVDFSICRKRGFKTVQARRIVHGAQEFPCNDFFCSDGTNYQSYTATPSKRYLTYSAVIDYHYNNTGNGNYDIQTNISISNSVDPLSGLITAASDTTSVQTQSGTGDGIWTTTNCVGTYTDNDGNVSDVTGVQPFASKETSNPLEDIVEPDCTTIPSYVAFMVNSVTGSPLVFTGDGYELHYSDDPDPVTGDVITLDVTITMSRLGISWTMAYLFSQEDGAAVATETYNGSILISNENTTAQSDAKYLGGLWDLTDDKQYPFRTDSYPQICPLVSRNEVPGAVSPVGILACDPSSYSDPNALLYDGSILGAPKSAGYENYWDSRCLDSKLCCVDDPDSANNAETYHYGYGGITGGAATVTRFNSVYGTQLPLTATQWTDRINAMFYRPQAFSSYNDQQVYHSSGECSGDITGDGALVIQKFATIKEKFPSQNLARPAGDDKFLYDEVTADGVSKVYAATNVSGSGEGSTWTLADYNGLVPTVNVPSSGEIWGGKVTNGFYTVSSYDSGTGTVTLGAQKFDMPLNWASRSKDDEICFGKVRWPDSPGILGRLAINSIDDIISSRLLTMQSAPALGWDVAAAETVDLCAADMSVLGSTVTITRVKARVASKAYSSGDVVIDGNGNAQAATTPGTSDASAPTWATTLGTTTNDGTVVWTLVKLGIVADQAFTVPTALADIANSKWIISHGASKWYWNDQFSKNQFVTLAFGFDFRTPGEAARVNAIISDCPDGCDCSGLGGPYTVPGTDIGTFSKTESCLPFNPCNPQVICFSPNDESFKNGVTYDIPDLDLDETYGNRWQGEVVMGVVDPLWQTPHHPVNDETNESVLSDDDTPPLTPNTTIWLMDDGSCHADFFTDTAGDTDTASGFWTRYYPYHPLVEPLLELPANGGAGQDETAPSLPSGITFGFIDPTSDPTNGIQPFGAIGASFTDGSLNGVTDERSLKESIESSTCSPDCQFSTQYQNDFGIDCP